jgi:hypothetical protein
VLLADEGAFRDLAHAHGVPPGGATEFSCLAGEGRRVRRLRPALGEVLFQRRLEASYGALERTWLEDGCGRVFAEDAARELGEKTEAARRARDDLVDAFLPIFLGAEPALAKTALRLPGLRPGGAGGRTASVHGAEKSGRPGQARALAYAVARYLLEAESSAHTDVIREAFAAAAGREGAAEKLAAREPELRAAEPAFERWLRAQTTDALLDALAKEPILAARREARSALRLVTGVDVVIDDGAPTERRAALVAAAREPIARERTVRFTDELEPRLAELRGSRRRSGALEQVVASARALLEERSRGFGHPAVEEWRGQLGKVIDRKLREGDTEH